MLSMTENDRRIEDCTIRSYEQRNIIMRNTYYVVHSSYAYTGPAEAF